MHLLGQALVAGQYPWLHRQLCLQQYRNPLAAEGQRARRMSDKRLIKSIARLRKALEKELSALDVLIKSFIGGGRKSVRNSLFVGAMVAARYNPQLKSFRDKLVAGPESQS